MLVPSLLLLVIGSLGAFDIAWFHTYKGRLVERAECRSEVVLHVIRGIVYAVQFVVVPNVEMRGRWLALLALLFAIDIVVGVADILVEPKSRAPRGGLSGGEYLVHMILSVLVGAELCSIAAHAIPLAHEPTAIAIVSSVPAWLRVLLGVMAAGSLACAVVEALMLGESRRGPAAPIHVRVRLRAPLARVWNVTQDHRLHPSWDHRFDRIVMDHAAGDDGALPLGSPDPRIGTGSTMRYEKRVLGVTIRGWGRYDLHKPMRQSTFAFGSDDPRSLIARGVGLWLYSDVGDGLVEMSTSYTYEVRWGVFGRLFDRVVFRPLFQRYTEASFLRLARDYFGERTPLVLGREGRRPKRFEVPALRALEAREVLPVGASKPVQIDVRFVSATHRPLAELVAAKTFRDDLYWRVRGIEVELPRLVDRPGDVLLLAQHFLNQARALVPGSREPRLSADAQRCLERHAWPGNLRELRNEMQRALVLSGGRPDILPEDLSPEVRGVTASPEEGELEGATLEEKVAALERREILRALGETKGNKSQTAERLGLSRQGLLNKMARFGIR